MEGLPQGRFRINSPHDLDARWGAKRDTFWNGYKVHVTETCGISGGSSSDEHGADDREAVAPPHLITNVETTDATVLGNQMTAPIHGRLAGRACCRPSTLWTRAIPRRSFSASGRVARRPGFRRSNPPQQLSAAVPAVPAAVPAVPAAVPAVPAAVPAVAVPAVPAAVPAVPAAVPAVPAAVPAVPAAVPAVPAAVPAVPAAVPAVPAAVPAVSSGRWCWLGRRWLGLAVALAEERAGRRHGHEVKRWVGQGRALERHLPGLARCHASVHVCAHQAAGR